MANYKYQQFLNTNQSKEFDLAHAPGVDAPNPGIYRCAGCGDEIGIAKGHKFPPQNHHQHTMAQGQIRWQLIVCAVQR